MSLTFPIQEYLRRSRSDITRIPPQDDQGTSSPRKVNSEGNSPHDDTPKVRSRGEVQQPEIASKGHKLTPRSRRESTGSSDRLIDDTRARRDTNAADLFGEGAHKKESPRQRRCTVLEYGKKEIEAIMKGLNSSN